jgi:CRP-like cAMP-binding protein
MPRSATTRRARPAHSIDAPVDDRTVERNDLLCRLPNDVYETLLPHLEPVDLSAHFIVWKSDARIHAVYFPRTAAFSILIPVAESNPVESATVGHEGMVGVPVLLDAPVSHSVAIVQVAGEAARVDAMRFREWMRNQDEATRSIFFRYVHMLLEQTAQSVACNRKHSLEERCARWLLATRDRVDSDEFALTHEFLAAMLGVRRAGVSVAAGMLQHAGMIRYSHGRVTILEPKALEEASCECYAVGRAQRESLMSER